MMMSLFSLLDAVFERWHPRSLDQQAVVVCMKKESRVGAGIAQKDFEALLHRLQRVVHEHPAAAYDGKEIHGSEVRLYFFSHSAPRLAKALAVAMSDLCWCRGAVVRVCSDIGARLEEHVVPLISDPVQMPAPRGTTRSVDLR
jgi:hypothetical protein